MILEFKIRNQILERNDDNAIVSKSKNYLYCQFSFETDEWANIEKFAIFKDDVGRAYNVRLENNKCLVPDDVLRKEFFRVSVYGGDLITTTEQVVVVIPSGYTKHICRASKGTRDVYVQAFEQIKYKIDDIVFEDECLNLYANGNLVKSVDIISDDLISDILDSIDYSLIEFKGSYNDLVDVPESFPPENHIHTSDDISDFEEKTAYEIKKSYLVLSNKIRTYGE